MIKEYLFPKSVNEAVEILKKYNGGARVISGGTDLVIDIENETVKTEVLVDVTRIEGCGDIKFCDGYLILGAGVTMTEASANERIKSNVYSLAKAAGSVGSVQIRNTATLTGNVVRAQPAADSAVMLAALDAVLTVCGPDGTKDIPVQDTYAGVGKSVIDPTKEVVSTIKFKEPLKNQGSGFVRLVQRKALALPMLNVGAVVSIGEGKIEWARITMAPVGTKPIRAAEAENFLVGKIPSDDVLKEAGKLALKNAAPRTSLIRGSKEYRTGVLPSLVTKALKESINEVRAKGGM